MFSFAIIRRKSGKRAASINSDSGWKCGREKRVRDIQVREEGKKGFVYKDSLLVRLQLHTCVHRRRSEVTLSKIPPEKTLPDLQSRQQSMEVRVKTKINNNRIFYVLSRADLLSLTAIL